MTKVVVVGAGFAGVWTAAGIVRQAELHGGNADPIQVTVVAPNDDLVIRPRLYEDDPQSMRVPLDRTLGPIGVKRVAATVTEINTVDHTVTALDREARVVQLPYDRLVLAAGSSLVRPQLQGSEHLFDVDSMPAAARLHAHINNLGRWADHTDGSDAPTESHHPGQFTAVVVGGGFTGLEVATELPRRLAEVAGDHPVRVILVDRAEELAAPLGEGPRPTIAAALDQHGVEVRQGASVESLTTESVTLTGGEVIPASTVIWTAGMRASSLTDQVPGERDKLGRLVVDSTLRVIGVPDVYATGDCAAAQADAEHLAMQACQHAVPLGKHAGHNVAADLLGRETAEFAPDQYVTCLDLGPGEAVFTTGWDREVQMTGQEAKALKSQINTEWIYPPVDDRQAILDLADHRRTWPID
ncbi:NAD(P)/FAD-dependent oxidoreductase [Kocuria sp.]|uniref:NAD(P)/FAD-dependent oxidoreductase n=1 Tax=Kocuria sp. TaxID=1871328 RepID=UPI0026DF4379|nr:FAD-dependent oxidoreductase [Kocuria sp.]MDO5619762.1 FAD-dependent oxidoreductase [Kocuria sp.]